MATQRREINRPPVTPNWLWLERSLWFAAAGLLVVSALMLFEGKIYQMYLKSQFQEELSKLELSQAQHPTSILASASAIARSAPEPYIGRLEIPRLDVSLMLLDGVDDATLRFGPGHIPGTALPGQPGNSGIAGHRDTFFRGLESIRKDDEITVTTLDGEYRYSVDTIRIVDPAAVEVLQDSGTTMLTLVTCYPFRVIGPAPKRFVVQATMK